MPGDIRCVLLLELHAFECVPDFLRRVVVVNTVMRKLSAPGANCRASSDSMAFRAATDSSDDLPGPLRLRPWLRLFENQRQDPGPELRVIRSSWIA